MINTTIGLSWYLKEVRCFVSTNIKNQGYKQTHTVYLDIADHADGTLDLVNVNK